MALLDLDNLMDGQPRHHYSKDQIRFIYNLSLTRLIRTAQTIVAQNFNDDEIQLCSLLSIKTGGCKEDCAYCPQSAHYDTGLQSHTLLNIETIVEQAKQAKANGATRFCMGAAWRNPPTKGQLFDQILETVRKVNGLGLEVCTTLGMLTEEQAHKLKASGVYAYNHNLDTSPEYYGEIISTRTYQDRLETLRHVRKAGMTVCCGGIIGMGESLDDRIGLLHELHKLTPHPESVPINLLVKVKGTPLEDCEKIDIFEMVRTIATARIIMPKSRVRLSAGRTEMSEEAQAMCFLAGANSIFFGEKLLTTDNPDLQHDLALLKKLGLKTKTPGQQNSEQIAYNEFIASRRDASPVAL